MNIGFGSKVNGEKRAESEPRDSVKDSATSTTPNPTPAPVQAETPAPTPETTAPPAQPAQPGVKLSMSLGDKKPKNVFANTTKKNPLAGKKGPVLEPPKKMSEQERIMKTEMETMERKRMRAESGMPNAKRPKVS